MRRILIFFLLFINSLYAQTQFRGSAKGTVRVGERFNIIYEINTQGTNFKAPTFRDFNTLSGPSQSSNSITQIINGKVNQSASFTYTYVVEAIKEGKFTIPPASIKADGKNIESNSITINVVKGQAPAAAANQGGQQQKQLPASQNVTSDDVFVKASVDKTNPWQGEEIIVTYKIYFRISISQLGIEKTPANSGFWSQNISKESDRPRQTQENINGSVYTVAEIYRIALFAQKSGKLTISPIELQCIAQIKSQKKRNSMDPFDFFNDPFFGGGYQNVKLSLKSTPVTINVKPLPENNKPSDFSGMVGNFNFQSTIDKKEVKTNEAINLKYVVSGKGNISLIEKPDLKFPPDLETYDPKINNNISTSASGVSGSKTFEYLIIPRNAGEFKIESKSFSYFDPVQQSYKTLTTPEYTLKITKGDGTQSTTVMNGINQEDIKYIGKDIKFIKTKPFSVQRLGYTFYNSGIFLALIFFPLFLFFLFIFIWRKEIKKRSNKVLMKNIRATKVARKRLKTAELHIKNNNRNDFYIEISKALWGYIGDKFSIPVAELSMENIQQKFHDKQVNEEITNVIIKTLEDCEFARFAPSNDVSDMNKIYGEAIETITKIEKELRN